MTVKIIGYHVFVRMVPTTINTNLDCQMVFNIHHKFFHPSVEMFQNLLQRDRTDETHIKTATNLNI